MESETQLEVEGIAIPFNRTLSECVLCGNALLSINNSTPYNAVYGRVPRILPSIDQIAEPDSSVEPMPGAIRDSHRLREISVQSMIEGSATARLGRAMNTRTTMAAQHLQLRIGDEVDMYKNKAIRTPLDGSVRPPSRRLVGLTTAWNSRVHQESA